MAPKSGPSASEDLRRRLLGAALSLLRESDEPLDLRKVARNAGKSRTAPYLVFGKGPTGGLMGLMLALAAEGTRQLAERMEVAEAEGAGDPLVAFEAVVLAFLTFEEENRELFRLMYGPQIEATRRVNEKRDNEERAKRGLDPARVLLPGIPDFDAMLDHRRRANGVLEGLIGRAQKEGFLPPDADEDGVRPPEERSGARRLQVALSTMIGVAFLRDDSALRAVEGIISREQGARLVMESVFGLDPRVIEGAAIPFLESEAQADAGVITALERRVDPPDEPEPWFDVSASLQEGFFPEEVPRAPEPPRRRPTAIQTDFFPAPQSELPLESPPARQVSREATLASTLSEHSGFHRAARSRTILSRARILWIDDHPETVFADVFRKLGAHVETANGTGMARYKLGRGTDPGGEAFNLILSDIARGSRPDAGVRALPELADVAPGVPVIFYIADLDRSRGVPRGAAGITNRPNELLHLVLDALEGR